MELCNNGLDDDGDGLIDGEDQASCPPGCDDADGDGQADQACGGTDCADDDPTIFLGAPERCNDRDDDCDGARDESWAELGAPCVAGLGACAAEGAWICSADGTGVECDAQPSPPAPERCDGMDDDCDGVVDDGASLPGGRYGGLTYIEAGWFGVPASALLSWPGYAGLWDAAEGRVSRVAPLADWWALAPAGDPPPAGEVDALLALPAGTFGLAADTLVVIAGADYYGLVTGPDAAWVRAPIDSLLPGVQQVNAATVFQPGDFGLDAQGAPTPATPLLTVIVGDEMRLLGEAGWTPPTSVVEFSCAEDGPCPRAIDAMTRVPPLSPGEPGGLTVHDPTQGLLFNSVFSFDAQGALHLHWVSGDPRVIPCGPPAVP